MRYLPILRLLACTGIQNKSSWSMCYVRLRIQNFDRVDRYICFCFGSTYVFPILFQSHTIRNNNVSNKHNQMKIATNGPQNNQ